MAYRLLVTGTRDCPKDIVWRYLEQEFTEYLLHYVQGDHFVVVHGDCPTGADAHARSWCAAKCLDETGMEPHPANWDRDGKAAGFIRNSAMVERGADKCGAFWNGEHRAGKVGAGTHDCFTKAVRAGIPVQIIPVGRTSVR